MGESLFGRGLKGRCGVVVALAFAAAMFVAPSGALASTGWSAPQLVDPYFPGASVSCPSASFCVAVDNRGRTITYNGGSWSRPPTVIDPGQTRIGPHALLATSAVSCASAAFCVAVDLVLGNGSTFDGTSWSQPSPIDAGLNIVSIACPSTSFCTAVDKAGGAVTFDGSSWSGRVNVGGGSGGYSLTSVSCSSSSFCVAVDRAGDAFKFDGNSWSGAVTADSLGSPTSVSCPSSTFCVAVDDAGNAATFDGNSWHAPASIDGSSRLTSVSCPSATSCVAVDAEGNAATFDGGSWTTPTHVVDAYGLQSVSCASASFCAAIGREAVTFDGSSWSAPARIGTGGFRSVSCASTAFCVALADGGNALTFDGHTWSEPQTIDPQRSLTSVSCPSSSFCIALDDQGNGLTFDARAWTAPRSIGLASTGPGTSDVPINAVSCVSATFCVAVDQQGRATVFDGSSWSTPATIDTVAPLTSVSCVSTSFCVAVDLLGYQSAYNGRAWSPAVQTWPNGSASVSCASARFCGSAGRGGAAEIRENGAPGPEGSMSGHGSSVSCPSASFCVDTDDHGDGYIYDGVSWSPGTAILPADYWFVANVDAMGYPVHVSCAPSLFCAAVSDLGDVTTYTPPPPSNVSPPTISGTTVEGQVLTEGPARWSYGSSVLAYQWQDCDSSGRGCEPIPGANGQTYTLTSHDVGHTIRVSETTSNLSGTGGPVDSGATSLVKPGPRPILMALDVTPRKFALAGRWVRARCVAATRSNRHHRSCRRAIALRVRYSLRLRSGIAFTLREQTGGRLVAGRCVAARRANRRHRPCHRWITLRARFPRSGGAGQNSFTFHGRAGGRELGPGTYELIAAPVASGSRGDVRRIRFRILSGSLVRP